VRPRPGLRTMEQREAAVNATWQQRRVFVVRLHDEAVSLEVAEVFGEGQSHSGPSPAVRRIGDGVSSELLDKRDARVFDPPELLRILVGLCLERGCRIDRPAIDTVEGSGGAEM
jgi:hypothetical protein